MLAVSVHLDGGIVPVSLSVLEACPHGAADSEVERQLKDLGAGSGSGSGRIVR
jgi:hypothetical protein